MVDNDTHHAIRPNDSVEFTQGAQRLSQVIKHMP